MILEGKLTLTASYGYKLFLVNQDVTGRPANSHRYPVHSRTRIGVIEVLCGKFFTT